MTGRIRGWWDRLRVQQKIWVVLLGLLIPLLSALEVHIYLINQLLSVQQQREQVLLANQHVQVVQRLISDLDEAFHGYALTRQPAYLTRFNETNAKLKSVLDKSLALAVDAPGFKGELRAVQERLARFMAARRPLVEQLQEGRDDFAMTHIRSGRGLVLSEEVRLDLRAIEDRLTRELQRLAARSSGLSRRTFWGLIQAVIGGLVIGALGARLLANSITRPLARLRASVGAFGRDVDSGRCAPPISIRSSDEIGELARAYEEMAERIRRHIRELETLGTIGNEINTIRPDGLDGALKRIADRALELIDADVCLVMLRNERMQCWVVEAASGDWNDRLHKSVMLWEEFPTSVRAFETQRPAVGEGLRGDDRPEVIRRNLIGDSELSIPLLAPGGPFGVLALIREHKDTRGAWNLHLARGLAAEAALAISNVRLYEAAYQRQKDLMARLRHLEHLAETLAHDLKGPGERMEGLAALLAKEYRERLDERGARWLALIEQNGRELVSRVEGLLAVARVGARQEAVAAVDPAHAIGEVLKTRAWELEQRCARIEVQKDLPLVACHRAYLRQVFDNVISNSLKFTPDDAAPDIAITAVREGHMVCFAVRDRGVGIPVDKRDKVFEPFVRLQAEGAKGSGIGLTIVKRIVELYGGTVWIESNEGPGCTVKFTLPVLGEIESVVSGSLSSVEKRPRSGD
ncbi:MAG TPA: ATP-binding protein [Nitrospiraceae bacterium]|jgi:signal transduction histidine kinase/CHASE3 domain sensor protein|nr:ATP-binding protein [Nitrospiraceae bacterium]